LLEAVLHLFLVMVGMALFLVVRVEEVVHQVVAQVAPVPLQGATVFLAQVVVVSQVAERQSNQRPECQHFL
jgi:uncharacterized protein YqhQ